MPRSISPQLAALLALPSLETQSTLVLTYSDGVTVKRLATADLTIGGQHFTPFLKRVGEIQQSLAKTVDRVGITLQNVDKLFGLDIAGEASALDMAEAVVGRFFRNPRDESQTAHANLFRGRVTNVSADENQITFDVISDIVAAGLCVSPRTLAQKCAWRFKSPECGYVGPLQRCNKILKSADGCLGRNNTHRFGGWTFPLPPSPSVPGTGGNEAGGSGGGGGNMGCFTGETLVLLRNGKQKPIREIKKGDLVLAFDEFETIQSAKVVSKFTHVVEAIYLVKFANNKSLRVTPEHLIYCRNSDFVGFRAMRQIAQGENCWYWTKADGWQAVEILEKTLIVEKTEVFNLHVEPCNTFFVNQIAVHNAKNPGDLENWS